MADGGGHSLPRFAIVLLIIIFLIRLVLDRTVERRQHPLHFPQHLLKSSSLAGVEDSQGASALELSIYLVSGCESDLQVSGELALAPLTGTFSNVVADGVDRSKKLRSEPGCGASDRSPEGRVVALDR